MITEKIIGDKKFTKETGGNSKHGGFWHYFFTGCHCKRSETETILSPDRPEYTSNYYSCGYWEKESVTKITSEKHKKYKEGGE
jgi:hypothetical protein